MLKELKLSNLTDLSEVAFSVCTLFFVCCYTFNYYFGGDTTLSVVAAGALLLSCLLFCILCAYTNYVAKDAMYWDRSHRFLSPLRVKHERYTIPGLYHIKLSYFWRHWVFGVCWKRCLALVVTVMAIACMCGMGTLAVIQHWQYQIAIIPVSILTLVILCYYAYRIIKLSIFRSGAPVIRYLMHSGESIESITADFRQAMVISRNVRIGSHHIFCRINSVAWVINLHCISHYELCQNAIIVLPVWGTCAEILKFKNKRDYNEVAYRIIQ